MRIKGKFIRNLTKVIAIAGNATEVRLVYPLSELSSDILVTLGFDLPPKVGDFLIPSRIGRCTEFNANGLDKPIKELPKIKKSITYWGASIDWHGGIHHGIRHRTIKAYPTEHIPAPSETLQIIKFNDEEYLSSSILNLVDEDSQRNIHVCNLMLECCSAFEVFDLSKNNISGPKLKRLQWEILPKGSYPWERSKGIIQRAIENINENDQKLVEHRMKTISRKEPDFLATGKAGFSGYFVYGFESQNVYVLESIYLDNATYVFDGNWKILSQLTKRDIIQGKIPHKRIVHNHKWATTLGLAIDGKI